MSYIPPPLPVLSGNRTRHRALDMAAQIWSDGDDSDDGDSDDGDSDDGDSDDDHDYVPDTMLSKARNEPSCSEPKGSNLAEGTEHKEQKEKYLDIKNLYYNSKGLVETDPEGALAGFSEVVQMEPEKAEWGFKALKQTVKFYYRLGRYKEMTDAYREMLTHIKEVKGFKGYRKTSAKVKAVYVRKDVKVANVVEEQKKVLDGLIVDEKMVGEAVQETDVSLNVSEDKEESAFGLVESDVSLNVANGEDQKGSTVELVETESVDENDDVLKLNVEMDVVIGKIEVEEDQDVCENENVIVGSKKVVYSREELEALRYVDEDWQTSKWIEVYCSFAPLVAREYTGLVVDATRQTQEV